MAYSELNSRQMAEAEEPLEALANRIDPPAAVVNFMSRLAEGGQAYEGEERRSEPRFAITMTVWTRPMKHRFQVVGEEVAAITRDISAHGIALLCARPVSTPYLAVRMMNPQGESIVAVFRVTRCQARGPVHEIAGEFVAQLSHELPVVPEKSLA
jgi:hypothetical protein